MLRVISQFGRAGLTFQLTSTNVAQVLAAAVLVDGGRNLCAMLITIITNDVKIALGDAVPVSGAAGVGLGHVLKKDLPPIYIVGETACSGFQYISSVSGAAGALMVTPFYAG